nr:MAG TPA_asm: hypothetical protein [Bacteriophage sp.]
MLRSSNFIVKQIGNERHFKEIANALLQIECSLYGFLNFLAIVRLVDCPCLVATLLHFQTFLIWFAHNL